MITAPTQASKEAMEAKTLVVPPKERTEEGGLPSGGEVGQVVTKTADGAQWEDVPQELPDLEGSDAGDVLTNIGNNKTAWVANHDVPAGGLAGQVLKKATNQDYACQWGAPSIGLCKNTSSSTKISFNVPDTTTLPSTVGGSDNWTVSTVEVPDEIMNILNGQYEGGTYATSVVNVIVGYPDPDDPEETMEIVGKVFLNYRVRYISNRNMSLSFDQFNYISSSGKLYIITLPDITYYNNEWSAQGSDIYVECLMGNA